MDQDEKALAHARAALQEAREIDCPWSQGVIHRVMGEVTAHVSSEKAGTEAEPASSFEESIRVLREIGAEAELARSLAAYGLFLRHSSDTEEARRSGILLDEAKALFQRLGMAWDLAQLEAETSSELLPGQVGPEWITLGTMADSTQHVRVVPNLLSEHPDAAFAGM